VYVACSTLCFSKDPLELALRRMADLEFHKVDLEVVESGGHLKPSEIAENLEASLQRLRQGPSLSPSAIGLDFGDIDPLGPIYRKRFDAACRMAKSTTVAVLTIPAAPLNSPVDAEVKRLTELSSHAMRQGLVVAVETNADTLTADPSAAAALCRAVPGLGLTLDPSHYIHGPHSSHNFDEVYPFVQNVHLRDTGKKPGEFQVRVGQGEIEYGRIVSSLERVGYNRALTVAILDRLDNPFEVEVEVRKLKLLLESLL
jgi:sugar phosphate isomerase/epimerase